MPTVTAKNDIVAIAYVTAVITFAAIAAGIAVSVVVVTDGHTFAAVVVVAAVATVHANAAVANKKTYIIPYFLAYLLLNL